ncbi:thiamine diphosphokinase [Alloscardovia omnicolens]|uniref:thiamine diphosphokinase n=1 Tax=Alloscardovia omnicolens TaxID=419015 RepID=UPI003A615AF5
MSLRRAKKAVIFGAGEYFDEMPFIPADAYVIAADGGYDQVTSLGITPHAFIGDMDSVMDDYPVASSTHIIELPSEKDDSDMMAAVRYAWQLGIRQFEFYGVFGGRIDHSFANIQLAAKIAQYGGIAFMHGDHVLCTVITNAVLRFPAGYVPSKRPLSVFSYSSHCNHVSIEGLKYTLTDVTMSNTNPIGLSNEFLPDTPATIAVDGGSLVIMYPSEAPTPSVESHMSDCEDFGALSQETSEHLNQTSSTQRRGKHAA